MERKTFPGLVTKADDEQGIIEAIFAVMGNIDQGDDIIHPGAFAKTFMERGGKVRVLDHHNASSIMHVIGKIIELRELTEVDLPQTLKSQYPRANGGAFAKVQMLMDTPEGKGAFIRLKEGAIDEWSFGYDALDVDFSKETRDGEDFTVRNLRTLKLYEISPVIWGMNAATTTTSAKEKQESKPYDIFEMGDEYCVFRIDEEGNRVAESLGCHPSREEAENQIQAILISEEEEMTSVCEEEEKTVLGRADLPLAAREREWDSIEAENRVRNWAGGEDDIDWTKYRQAFFWYDADAADQFGSYKLQFADVVGGELQAIPRGLFAVAAILQGARGGVDISVADQDKIKDKVEAYYNAMQSEFDDDTIVPPWEKSISWETLRKGMIAYYQENEVSEPTEDDVKAATIFVINELVRQTVDRKEKYIFTLEKNEYTTTTIEDFNENSKEGRVLSKRNATKIVNALKTLVEVLEAAGINIPPIGGTEEEEEDKALSDSLDKKLANDGAGPSISPTLLLDIEQELLQLELEMED